MEIYVPDVYQESIFKINYELLNNKGIKCLLFDLDNTLVSYNIKQGNEEIKNLFDELKKKFTILIFSNSPKKRVTPFGEYFNVDFVSCACKPSPKGFLTVMKKYKLTENEIAIIGDQLVTDIKGGNNVGITTVLVNPVSNYDPIYTKPGRFRERIIKKSLRKKNLFKGRFYDEKM